MTTKELTAAHVEAGRAIMLAEPTGSDSEKRADELEEASRHMMCAAIISGEVPWVVFEKLVEVHSEWLETHPLTL